MSSHPADYLEYATVYFWDETGSFSAESERVAPRRPLEEHRPYPGRRNSTSRNRRCGGSAARPPAATRPGAAEATSEGPRRHP
ncbi:hypothetical protein [Cryptosporangium aurantiacum]|uniref:Uncharacterized protein n=1 Tax=Cryptosporangium aurantiacum TaxID=134849 RepID=A0A1M7N136_9ACTN|nr:hypothetical protein [Cryptosporangium aurantiacum]SHM97220.1 hypothetical protein SAMN05443668_102369 [Cryptosporangium aurantiacum]